MCIAVIKPSGVNIPTKKTFQNCFESNPSGAGYMYIDNGYLHIKKGFMTFNDFYSSFSNEHFTKDDTLFIHFRIATHGLVDEGNTHPFPLTTNILDMRKTDYKFKGFGLIHNGIFHYNENDFETHDPSKIISDTMLFSMIVSNFLNKKNYKNNFLIEETIAYSLSSNDTIFHQMINENIGWSKVAIMKEDGTFIKFGKWIEHEGCFYSNSDYQDLVMYNNQNIHGFQFSNVTVSNDEYTVCDGCNSFVNKNDILETTCGYLCKECVECLPLFKCKKCGTYDLIENEKDKNNLCHFCNDNQAEKYEYICSNCGKKNDFYHQTTNGSLICHECFEKIKNLLCEK